MTRRLRFLVFVAILGVVVFDASQGFACPVCYGAPDSPATQGAAAAVFSLLGVTGGVLAVFASMFVRLRNRTKALESAETKP